MAGGIEMELTVGTNSYMSLKEADTIVENELLDTSNEYKDWKSLSEENKTKLIVKGTRTVDSIPFRGVKYNISRVGELQWPRLINNELIECPPEIKLALLMQVLRDYKNDNSQEAKLQEMGVKSYSINKASISFGDKNSTKLDNGIYNDIYFGLLRKWVL